MLLCCRLKVTHGQLVPDDCVHLHKFPAAQRRGNGPAEYSAVAVARQRTSAAAYSKDEKQNQRDVKSPHSLPPPRSIQYRR